MRSVLALLFLVTLGCEPVTPTSGKAPAAATTAPATAAQVAPEPEPQAKPLARVTLPATDANDQRLAVFLHGYGADEKDLPALARRMGLQGPVASLRAPVKLDRGGFAWFARDLRTAPDEAKLAEFDASVERLVADLKNLREEHPDREIVIAGFSQGAMIGAVVATEHGELVDRAVLLSGAIPRDFASASDAKPKVFVSHGDIDRIVPLAEGKFLANKLQQRGHDVELKIYPKMGHRILPAVIDDLKVWLSTEEL